MLLLCGPLFVVLVSTSLERDAPAISRPKLLALSGLGLGAAITCASQPRLSFDTMIGIALGLGSAAVGACGVVLSGILLSDGDLAPMALLFFLSPLQAALVGVALPFTEALSFWHWAAANPADAVARMGVGVLLMFAVQMATFMTVQRTSAVTASMLGNLKSVLTIALSVALLGMHLSSSCIAGYASSIVSGCAYTYVTVQERSRRGGAAIMRSLGAPDGSGAAKRAASGASIGSTPCR